MAVSSRWCLPNSLLHFHEATSLYISAMISILLFLQSCPNLLNTIYLLYTILILSSRLCPGLCLLPASSSLLHPQPQRSYLVQGALSPQLPALAVCRRGQICECSPPACFSMAVFGSDATINHTAGTDKVNRVRE